MSEPPRYDETFESGWSGGPGVCGGGSRAQFAGPDAQRFRGICRLLKKEMGTQPRVLEIGCGDLQWHLFGFPEAQYWGLDLHRRESWAEWEKQGFEFIEGNAADPAQALPSVDLVLCRAVLPHLSNHLVDLILGRIPETGARYFLATSRPGADNLARHRPGINYSKRYEPLDLEAAPHALQCVLPPMGCGLALFEV